MMRATLGFSAPRSVFLRAGAFFCAALALAGCNPTPPQVQTRVVAVPSSKPYRFIKYTAQCDAGTISRLKTHNYTHALVKKKEAEAAKP
jgi:hypothetical protein